MPLGVETIRLGQTPDGGQTHRRSFSVGGHWWHHLRPHGMAQTRRRPARGSCTIVFIPRNTACVLDWSLPGGQDHYFEAIAELAAEGGFTSWSLKAARAVVLGGSH